MREGLRLSFLKDLRGGFFEGLRGNLRALNLKTQKQRRKGLLKKFKILKILAQNLCEVFLNLIIAWRRKGLFEFKFHVASKACA